jgi:hypothetical protein
MRLNRVDHGHALGAYRRLPASPGGCRYEGRSAPAATDLRLHPLPSSGSRTPKHSPRGYRREGARSAALWKYRVRIRCRRGREYCRRGRARKRRRCAAHSRPGMWMIWRAFLAEVHPEVEWHGVIERAVGGTASTYRGHEGRGRLGLSTAARRLDVSSFMPGRSVTWASRSCSSATSSSLAGQRACSLAQEVGEAFTFRERKIATVHDSRSHAQALEAARVRE